MPVTLHSPRVIAVAFRFGACDATVFELHQEQDHGAVHGAHGRATTGRRGTLVHRIAPRPLFDVAD